MTISTQKSLNFFELLFTLSGYASFSLDQSLCLSLKFLNDLKVIDNEQRSGFPNRASASTGLVFHLNA